MNDDKHKASDEHKLPEDLINDEINKKTVGRKKKIETKKTTAHDINDIIQGESKIQQVEEKTEEVIEEVIQEDNSIDNELDNLFSEEINEEQNKPNDTPKVETGEQKTEPVNIEESEEEYVVENKTDDVGEKYVEKSSISGKIQLPKDDNKHNEALIEKISDSVETFEKIDDFVDEDGINTMEDLIEIIEKSKEETNKEIIYDTIEDKVDDTENYEPIEVVKKKDDDHEEVRRKRAAELVSEAKRYAKYLETYVVPNLETDPKKYDRHSGRNTHYNELINDKDITPEVYTSMKLEDFAGGISDSKRNSIEYLINLERTSMIGTRSTVAFPISGIAITFDGFRLESILKTLEVLAQFGYNDENVDILEKNNALLGRRIEEFNIIFSHIIEVRTQTGDVIKPKSVEELLSMIKLPDLHQLFLGVFEATYKDKNLFEITCHNIVEKEIKDEETGAIIKEEGVCGNKFNYYQHNSKITLLKNKFISSVDLETIRTTKKDVSKLEIVELGNGFLSILTKNKFSITLKIPTVQRYMSMFREMLDFSNGSEKLFYNTDLENLDSPLSIKRNMTEFDVIKLLLAKFILYTDNIICPVVKVDENNKRKLSGYRVTTPKDIINVYRNLNEEVLELCQDKQFINLIKLKALDHYITGSKCPECGNDILPMEINLEKVFFTNITERRNS